jgi:hypothetical protein
MIEGMILGFVIGCVVATVCGMLLIGYLARIQSSE